MWYAVRKQAFWRSKNAAPAVGLGNIMAIEKVKEYFNQFAIADRVQKFTVSSATEELAAQAPNCEPCRIAKTLSSMVDGHVVLIVTAGGTKIDDPKYKLESILPT